MHNTCMSIFCGLKHFRSNLKLKFSFQAALNFIFVIDIPGWLSSGLFLSAALPVKEIRIRLFYRVVKKSRSTPAFQISVLDK